MMQTVATNGMIMNTLSVHKQCCQDSLSLCPDDKSRAVTLSVGLEVQNPPGVHLIFLIPSLMKCTRSLTARKHKWLSWEKAIMDVHSRDSICTYALLSSFRASWKSASVSPIPSHLLRASTISVADSWGMLETRGHCSPSESPMPGLRWHIVCNLESRRSSSRCTTLHIYYSN